MKFRRGKKPTRDEWSQRAQAVFDRPAAPVNAEKSRVSPALKIHSIAQSIAQNLAQNLAHGEWTKWAQAALDRPSVASLPPVKQEIVEKPGRGEWVKWSQIVIDRLKTCAHVYAQPTFEGFMPPAERQARHGKVIDLLTRFHALTDDADTSMDSLNDIEHHDERVIAGLSLLCRDTLGLLPEISADMQGLLKSPWRENCNGRLANELFRGPLGHEPEGIGSGYAEQGRLPEVLSEMLRRETSGQGRHIREALRDPDGSKWYESVHRRWVTRNSRMLGGAGRVE